MKSRFHLIILLFILALIFPLQSCSPGTAAVLQMIPIRATLETDYGTAAYSSKSGVSLYVDGRSRK